MEALLEQEGLSADWELIIVDDGSTDGTADVARGYAARLDDARADDARADVARTDDARAYDERATDARADDARAYDACGDDASTNDGLAEDARTNDGRADDGRANEPRADAALPDKPTRLLVLTQENRGAAAARNAGVAAAEGEVLLFTDADCRPAPGWAAALVERLEAEPDVVAVTGLQRSDQSSVAARFVQAEYEEKQDQMVSRDAVTFLDTATAGVSADALRRVGGFDESLRRCEDTDLGFRLAADGGRVVVEPNAAVLHDHVTSAWRYARRKLALGYWGAGVYRLHRDMVADDSRTPWTMRAQMIAVPVLIAALLVGFVLLLLAEQLPQAWRAGAADVTSAAWLVAAAAGAVFVVSSVTFLRYASQHGISVVLLAPFMLLLRALALTAGLGLGLAHMGRPPRD